MNERISPEIVQKLLRKMALKTERTWDKRVSLPPSNGIVKVLAQRRAAREERAFEEQRRLWRQSFMEEQQAQRQQAERQQAAQAITPVKKKPPEKPPAKPMFSFAPSPPRKTESCSGFQLGELGNRKLSLGI